MSFFLALLILKKMQLMLTLKVEFRGLRKLLFRLMMQEKIGLPLENSPNEALRLVPRSGCASRSSKSVSASDLEARQRVVDMCADNIAAFARGDPANIDIDTGLPRAS